jgi:hypothetical protein
MTWEDVLMSDNLVKRDDSRRITVSEKRNIDAVVNKNPSVVIDGTNTIYGKYNDV